MTARTLTTPQQATSYYFRTSVDHPYRKALIQICEPCNETCKHCFVSATKRGAYMVPVLALAWKTEARWPAAWVGL